MKLRRAGAAAWKARAEQSHTDFTRGMFIESFISVVVINVIIIIVITTSSSSCILPDLCFPNYSEKLTRK